MSEDNKCDKGIGLPTGWCCCNCQNLIELYLHPANTVFKGRISYSSGLYACTVAWDADRVRKGIIMENKHGMCELHVPIEEKL